MAFRMAFRVGLPSSFVYCTIDQGIWTKEPDTLIAEQKDVWSRAIGKTVYYYHTLVPGSESADAAVAAKLDMLDPKKLKRKWNCTVRSSMRSFEGFLDHPQKPFVAIYDKLAHSAGMTNETKDVQKSEDVQKPK